MTDPVSVRRRHTWAPGADTMLADMSPTSRDADRPPLRPKCGSERTRIIGQSGEPPLVHYRCDGILSVDDAFTRCGHVFSRPLGDARED